MAAKLLHSLSDDNPELQKQIGCMTGIFQMFDRHHMIVSGKRIADQSHSQRRTLPRQSQFSNGSLEEDFIGSYQRQPTEMNSQKIAIERQRFSTESSRASFSSSRSSSFSSVDYCRSHQPEPAYNDRITFPEAAFEDSRCSMSPRLSRQSADFRDIVKDSMIKEARCLLNKPTRDSFLSETVARVVTNGNQNARDGIMEPIKGPSKLLGAKYKSREASRISYDGMETSRFSFESREVFTASKLRDLPRLSLDDRECLMRQADSDSLSNSQLKASLKRSCSTNEKGHNLREMSVTQQRRPPNLVAKLMGLTALPGATSGSSNDKGLLKNSEVPVELDALKSSGLKKQNLEPFSSGSKKEPASPRWLTSEMKPISSARIHVEPAPWKKADSNANASLLNQSSRRVRSPTRQQNSFPSVYSEIEKRFKDIEFSQSGKDLRALKQILESIHAKGLLENEREEKGINTATSRKHASALNKSNHKKITGRQDNGRGKIMTERADSPIVIMKPISRPPKSVATKNMNTSQTISSDEKFKHLQHSMRPHQQAKDNTTSSPRNLGSLSPRTRLKKLELEKQIQVRTNSSDTNKDIVQVSKKLPEPNSPGGKMSLKSSSLEQNAGQIRAILLDIKKLRSRENEAALATDVDIIQDREARHSVRSSKLNGSRSPSKKASKPAVLDSDNVPDPPSYPIQHDEASPEHPSPVSVLRTSASLNDTTAEEKQLTKGPGDVAESDRARVSNELAFNPEISRKKLLSIDSLVQKLKRLNSTHDESKTDYIALLTEDTDTTPDNRYISEILLASGLLLREFGSNAKNPIQLHPSGNLINPELFNVLEQTKSNDHRLNINSNTDVAKTHRKLIFDTLNEILAKKLTSNRSQDQKLARKGMNTQNLIKELCKEMEELECRWGEEDDESDGGACVKDMLREDVMQERSVSMFEFGVSEVVLDVERLIFKDIVDEIVMGGGGGGVYRSRTKSGNCGGFRFLK